MPLHSLPRPLLGSISRKYPNLQVGVPVELVPPPPAGYARFVGDNIGFSFFNLPNMFLLRNTLDSSDENDTLDICLFLERPSAEERIEILRTSIPPGVPWPLGIGGGLEEFSKFALTICFKGDEYLSIELLDTSVSKQAELTETHNDYQGSIIEVARPEIPPLVGLDSDVATPDEILAALKAQGGVIVPSPIKGQIHIPLLRGAFFGVGPCFTTNPTAVEMNVGTAIKNLEDDEVFLRFPGFAPVKAQGILDAVYAVPHGQEIVAGTAAPAAAQVPGVRALMTYLKVGAR